jgi:alpha-L-rhamnosidase
MLSRRKLRIYLPLSAVLVLSCLWLVPERRVALEDHDPPAIFLPLVMRSSAILSDAAIWAHDSQPARHEVVLFRRTFELPELVEAAELQIFADTRYELWVDGAWQGRGPARFSQTLLEYDAYQLGSLVPGNHSIAVLVQWAPNERRAESISPRLVAHIQAKTPAGWIILAQTSAVWKAALSDAWQADAQPVDTRNLIGPTEMLDFSRLPVDWSQPGFDDHNWPQAILRSVTNNGSGPAKFVPRSIPPLENFPMPAVILDAGSLSPGFRIGELAPPLVDPYTLHFSTAESSDLVVEALADGAVPPDHIKLDGRDLIWQAAGSARPDVFRSQDRITSGDHRLKISHIPVDGITFGISAPGVSFTDFPFQQGRHAGRRNLLAVLSSDPSVVQSIETSAGWDLNFSSLPAYLVLDLGRTVHGRVVAEVTGPAGSVVDIGWDERLWTEKHRPLPYPGSMYPEWNQVDSWLLDGKPRLLTTIDTRAGRYLLIAVWGSGTVRLDTLRVYEERYPAVQVGQFHSSDPLLDRIWQVGVDTLRPNMTDAFTDTPWRERGQWWGDAFVEHHVSRIAFGDTALTPRGLTYLADAMAGQPSPGMAPNNNGLHMLDYTMLWVQSLADEATLSANLDLVKRLYPRVIQFMEHAHSFADPQTGLLNLPREHWTTTAYIDLYGYYSRYGQSAALNALYVETLSSAARIAELAGEAHQAALWRTQASEVRDALNAVLYRPVEGRYVSTIFAGEPVTATIHAQAWPLAYGIAPPGRESGLADELLKMLPAQPGQAQLGTYGMYWVLEALGKTDHLSEALDVIRLYYGYMLDRGATTWWESFTADESPQGSFSHGWGGAPTVFLTNYVLGARRFGPANWQVKPPFEGVSSASGVLPLADGEVEIQWERSSCGGIRLVVQASDSSTGEVVVPNFHPRLTLTLNGELVWDNGVPTSNRAVARDDEIILNYESSPFELVGRYPCPPVSLANDG